jgi:hypothetical protein
LAPWHVAQCPDIWAALTDYVNAGRELFGDDGDAYMFCPKNCVQDVRKGVQTPAVCHHASPPPAYR